jgi:hypothetical protein
VRCTRGRLRMGPETWLGLEQTHGVARLVRRLQQGKHDRTGNLNKATLQRCIEAVAANIVLFCVRFSPFPLYTQNTPVASLASHLFKVDLIDCDPATFYVPLVEPPAGATASPAYGDGQRMQQPWTSRPLVL